jgi:peptidoglycan/LPS O-acetylase OafA/YrhL
LTLYQKPWHRIGPYLVGMWMGYVLFQIGKKPVKLPKFVVIGGWLLSTATALSLLLGIMPYYDPSYTGSAIGAGVYAGLSRFVWGIVICWIIFACVKGYGGWVNAFLSWKAFIPLGRLTFCVYLSSFSVQALLQLTIKQPMLFGMYTMVRSFATSYNMRARKLLLSNSD